MLESFELDGGVRPSADIVDLHSPTNNDDGRGHGGAGGIFGGGLLGGPGLGVAALAGGAADGGIGAKGASSEVFDDDVKLG